MESRKGKTVRKEKKNKAPLKKCTSETSIYLLYQCLDQKYDLWYWL